MKISIKEMLMRESAYSDRRNDPVHRKALSKGYTSTHTKTNRNRRDADREANLQIQTSKLDRLRRSSEVVSTLADIDDLVASLNHANEFIDFESDVDISPQYNWGQNRTLLQRHLKFLKRKGLAGKLTYTGQVPDMHIPGWSEVFR